MYVVESECVGHRAELRIVSCFYTTTVSLAPSSRSLDFSATLGNMKLLTSVFCLGLAGLATSRLPGAFDDLRLDSTLRPRRSQCEPFSINFSGFQSSEFTRYFVPISPAGSYELGSDGLDLYLDRPHGKINTKGNVNDKVAEGATINSTATLLFVIPAYLVNNGVSNS